jgi:ketosteroid isomerase-like protein
MPQVFSSGQEIMWTIRNGKIAPVRSINDTALLAEAWRE